MKSLSFGCLSLAFTFRDRGWEEKKKSLVKIWMKQLCFVIWPWAVWLNTRSFLVSKVWWVNHLDEDEDEVFCGLSGGSTLGLVRWWSMLTLDKGWSSVDVKLGWPFLGVTTVWSFFDEDWWFIDDRTDWTFLDDWTDWSFLDERTDWSFFDEDWSFLDDKTDWLFLDDRTDWSSLDEDWSLFDEDWLFLDVGCWVIPGNGLGLRDLVLLSGVVEVLPFFPSDVFVSCR